VVWRRRAFRLRSARALSRGSLERANSDNQFERRDGGGRQEFSRVPDRQDRN
jgi:hypothetical protein